MKFFRRTKPKPQSQEAVDISTPGGLPEPPPTPLVYEPRVFEEKPPRLWLTFAHGAVLFVSLLFIVVILAWGLSYQAKIAPKPLPSSSPSAAATWEPPMSEAELEERVAEIVITAASGAPEAEVQALEAAIEDETGCSIGFLELESGHVIQTRTSSVYDPGDPKSVALLKADGLRNHVLVDLSYTDKDGGLLWALDCSEKGPNVPAA